MFIKCPREWLFRHMAPDYLVLVNEHKFVVVFVNDGTTWQMSYPLQPCMRLDLDFCPHNVPLLRSSHLWSGILHKCAFRAHEEKFATARSEGWRPDHSPLERRMDACHTLFRIESQKLTIFKNQEIFIILDNTYCLTEIIRPPCNFPNTKYARVYHKGWL